MLVDANADKIRCISFVKSQSFALSIDSTLSHLKPQDHQQLLEAAIASQGSTLGEESRHLLDAQDPLLPPCCAPGSRARELSPLSSSDKWGEDVWPEQEKHTGTSYPWTWNKKLRNHYRVLKRLPGQSQGPLTHNTPGKTQDQNTMQMGQSQGPEDAEERSWSSS